MWKPQQQHIFASIHSCGLVSIQLSISINMSRMLLVCTAGTHHKIFELQHLKFIAAVFPWCKTPNLYHYANMVINNNVIFRISCHKQIKFYPSSYNWKIFKGSQKSSFWRARKPFMEKVPLHKHILCEQVLRIGKTAWPKPMLNNVLKVQRRNLLTGAVTLKDGDVQIKPSCKIEILYISWSLTTSEMFLGFICNCL